MKAHLVEEYRWRGLLYEMTETAADLTREKKVSGYVGFDPTADSLHVGNLVPIMGLVHLQRHGHRPIALVGGATGMIGDPSGKSKERVLLSKEILDRNQRAIQAQLEKFLDFSCKGNPATMVNNLDWLAPLGFIEFMRDVGKCFPINYMLAKESVKRRLEGEGISFTEFSYMLLQAYDFYHLNKSHGCELQLGGSDQWGNITAGIELIRRMSDRKAHGMVFPLVTQSSGQKFGKTEEGNVWLDPARTSPYTFYQFWLNSGDKDALSYLRYFTLLEEGEVAELAQSLEREPEKREAQRRLAAEVTERVHGPTELAKVLRASRVMFGEAIEELGASEIEEIFRNVPSTECPKTDFEGAGFPILDLFTHCGVTKSKGEARRLLLGGGIYVNNVREPDAQRRLGLGDTVEGRFLVLRKGGKTYHLVKLIS